MFDLNDLLAGTRDAGLPPSLLRPNSGYNDPAFSALMSPISEEQARENLNAAPWSKRFSANFIEPGLVLYKGKDGKPDELVLVEAETLERMAKSMIGKPVIDWDHADVWPEIIGDGQADGVCSNVWKGENGWWHVDYMLWTKSAIEHAESDEWSVSCAWSTIDEDLSGGKHHNIPYTQRLLDGVYTHLAQVKNPRFENARIRANSTDGGYKMAWELFKKKSEQKILRLNAAEAAGTKMDVDGEPVGIADLVAKHNAASAPSDILTCSDDDEVEFEGKRYKAGDLRNSHRNSMARKNAEEKDKADEKEKEERKNAAERKRLNDLQLNGAGAEKTGKLAGEGADKSDGVLDNPDKALEAGKELSALKERLNSLTAEIKELRSAPSRELREAANLRFAPVGGTPEDQGFVTSEDRIRQGNKDFALSSQ